eukprot:scaffold15780_cov68-Phaeocystis_antarctica.AAC.16
MQCREQERWLSVVAQSSGRSPGHTLAYCSRLNAAMPGRQPTPDREPLVPELGDGLHDDVILTAGPRLARALASLRRWLPFLRSRDA